MGHGPRVMTLVLAVLGVGLIAASLLPGDDGLDDQWTRDVLMTVGASFALFAPLYLLTRSLDRHLDQVSAETRQQVEEVRSDTAQRVEEVRSQATETSSALSVQVEALRADVDRRLDDVAERVAARLQAEAAADRAAFDSLRTDASREAIVAAMSRAHRLGLVSTFRPPRVSISDSARLYASIEYNADRWDDEELQLKIETVNGHVEEWIPWPEDRKAENVLVDVGRALSKHTNETFDPTAFLGGLADLLEAALSHPERRPAVQLCPPQWMVCEWGVVTYGRAKLYGVNHERLRTSTTITEHVASKTWVDVDSWDAAHEAALALFPKVDSPWAKVDNPWAGPAEPPF